MQKKSKAYKIHTITSEKYIKIIKSKQKAEKKENEKLKRTN